MTCGIACLFQHLVQAEAAAKAQAEKDAKTKAELERLAKLQVLIDQRLLDVTLLSLIVARRSATSESGSCGKGCWTASAK